MDLEAVARRLELEQLYTDYAHCLDAGELERWPDFFTEDCFYRITSAENYEAGLPLGLIYATSRNMLRDRVSALREANIYERQTYRHIIGMPALRPGAGHGAGRNFFGRHRQWNAVDARAAGCAGPCAHGRGGDASDLARAIAQQLGPVGSGTA